MAETEIIGKRLYEFDTEGSMGVVKNTAFRRCFWPRTDVPLNPFAEGSAGIEVEGPPTPRNIIFPGGTIFVGNTRGDCFFQKTVVVEDVAKAVVVTEVKPVDGVDREITYEKVVVVSEPVTKIVEIPKPLAASEALDEPASGDVK